MKARKIFHRMDNGWYLPAATAPMDLAAVIFIFLTWTNNGWSEACQPGGWINSDQWESQPCLSPDKRDLYFASRRHGGYGGSDIYVSHLQANGNGVNLKI